MHTALTTFAAVGPLGHGGPPFFLFPAFFLLVLLATAVVFGVLPPLFLLATNIGVLAACAFVVGMGIAPTLTTAFGGLATPPGTCKDH